MMNHNMNEVNNFYRPATFEAIMFNEPKKGMLLENYFAKQGIKMTASCVPTVNITYGIISARVTHIIPSGEIGYIGEMLAINKACESGKPVHVRKNNKHYYAINGCRFAYAADMPTSILLELMDKNNDNKTIYEQYVKFFMDKNESAHINELMEDLRKENEKLKAQIDELKTSIGKLFEIASK